MAWEPGPYAKVIELPPRAPAFGELTKPISPGVKAALDRAGIAQLYRHQAAAFDAAQAGKSVMVVTGTNSGKSLCYGLPALQALESEPAARALLIFPTKALARDQTQKLQALAPDWVRIGALDGDTPKSQRGPLRRMCHIVVTNPEMLHLGILPNHESWAAFLKGLRVVALDEMHVYKGVFGSQTAGVIRRLLTLCHWHRADPIVIGCSATVGNPAELFTKLVGREPTVIGDDGSPQGSRTLCLVNPYAENPEVPEPSMAAAGRILAELAASGTRTLAFNRTRIGAELTLIEARARMKELGGDPDTVESYRAGYKAAERRELEKRIKSGSIVGLSTTNALELGIDIGGLDAVIINGYPGSISSFWQQSGRAGRGVRSGLTVWIVRRDPLEQHFFRHPELLTDSQSESPVLNPENLQILSGQLRCAAYERGLGEAELERFGPAAREAVDEMETRGELGFGGGRWFFRGFTSPAASISLRTGGSAPIDLVCRGETIAQVDRRHALAEAHPGAIYLHRGAMYESTQLDLDSGFASLRRYEPAGGEAAFTTMPLIQAAAVQTLCIEGDERLPSVGLAAVTAAETVTGYSKRDLATGRVIAQLPLDLPDDSFETLAVKVGFPPVDEAEAGEFMASLHGVEHALLATAPLAAGCDRADLGSSWYVLYPDGGTPVLFVFDRVPGGIGLAERLHAVAGDWVASGLSLLTDCRCSDGCPACLLDPKCPSGNASLSKSGAIRLLRELLEATGRHLS